MGEMAWGEEAARSLGETFDGSFGAPGVVIAAACVDEAGVAIAARPGDAPADGRFEIGSVTKTMTATLLALLAADGTLRLDDEIGRWLSTGANGGITLRQLATHTSGLPRAAPNFDLRTADPANPWAGYGFERAEEGLRQAVADPERRWLYSNLGYQLLGLVLERASGHSYQELITGRLLEPLAMTCSGVGNSGGGTQLPGHAHGREVRHWDQLPTGDGRHQALAWRGRTRDLGPAGEVTVSCGGSSGRVVADATIMFANGAVALRIGFDPSGQIVGLRFLPPREESAALPD
jgi:CubicO group peptidase (beta-lactamase class C family)